MKNKKINGLFILVTLFSQMGYAQLSDIDYNRKMANECLSLTGENGKGALKHIDYLMKIAPDADSLYYMRAQAYLICEKRDGRTEKDFLLALADFDTFLAKQPNHIKANYMAATAAYQGVKKFFFIREKLDKKTSTDILQKAKIRLNAYYDGLEKLHKDTTDRAKEIEEFDLEISKIQNK